MTFYFITRDRPLSKLHGPWLPEVGGHWICINGGASFRWSFDPLSAWGSIVSTTIVTTHPSLLRTTTERFSIIAVAIDKSPISDNICNESLFDAKMIFVNWLIALSNQNQLPKWCSTYLIISCWFESFVIAFRTSSSIGTSFCLSNKGFQPIRSIG